MGTYQRYFAKSLIFVFSLFFFVFLLLESNIGFKWIFNITNYFFFDLKTEEISGNWRNFTLKNFSYTFFQNSVKANSINIIFDPISLFKNSISFKKVKIKNLVISFQKNKKYVFFKKSVFDLNKEQNSIFFKKNIFFRNIYCDKILLKTNKKDIFFFNIYSSIRLFNNHITIYPTNINKVRLIQFSNFINFFSHKKYFFKKNVFKINKIKNFFFYIKNFKKFFIPININLISIKCQSIDLFNKKSMNFNLELCAKLKKNVFKINKIKIFSKFLQTYSKGKIIFKKNSSIALFFNNNILLKRLYKKIINISLKCLINHALTFKLKLNNLSCRSQTNGKIFFRNPNFPIRVHSNINFLLIPISKNVIFSIKNSHLYIRGNINNYVFSAKNIFGISNIPSISIQILGKGSLNNIYLKKIFFLPLIRNIKHKSIITKLNNNFKNNSFLSKIEKKENILHFYKKNLNNFFAPCYGIKNNNKISIPGLFNFQSTYGKKTSRINFSIGKNKGFISGSLSKIIDVYSTININNLDTFIPNFKGMLISTLNIYGLVCFPTVYNVISGKKLNWKNFYIDNIKILTYINYTNKSLNNININIKKFSFLKNYFDLLKINMYWNKNTQNFYLFLKKNNILSIKLNLYGKKNDKIGLWKGFLKRMYIKSLLGKWILKNTSLFFYYKNNQQNFFQHLLKKNVYFKIKNFIHSYLQDNFQKKSILFRTQLLFNIDFYYLISKNIYDINIFFRFHNIKFTRKIKKVILVKNIHSLVLYFNYKKNNILTKWILQYSKRSLNNSIIGFLNVYDIFHTKKIKGKFILFNIPISLVSIFFKNIIEARGLLKGDINFSGTLCQPKIVTNIYFFNVYIKSNKILKYITLFFQYIPKVIEKMSTNQEIYINKGNVLFKLYLLSYNDTSNVSWNIIFHSNKVEFFIFPKIKFTFSSQLNLRYFSLKYNLIGYLKYFLFFFKIHEKNFFI